MEAVPELDTYCAERRVAKGSPSPRYHPNAQQKCNPRSSSVAPERYHQNSHEALRNVGMKFSGYIFGTEKGVRRGDPACGAASTIAERSGFLTRA